MKISAAQVGKAVEGLLFAGLLEYTHFIDNKNRVRVVRKQYKRGSRQRLEPIELTVTVGEPNYAEREIIRKLKRDGKSAKNHIHFKVQQ